MGTSRDDKLERRLRDIISPPPVFGLINHFNPDNILEVVHSQFPRLEALVAIQRELERTRRLLIVVAGFCILAGAALIVFAPQGKEGVSYVVGAALVVLSLGAIGVQEFRLKTVGLQIDAGLKAIESAVLKSDQKADT
jgi:hypothetical protein